MVLKQQHSLHYSWWLQWVWHYLAQLSTSSSACVISLQLKTSWSHWKCLFTHIWYLNLETLNNDGENSWYLMWQKGVLRRTGRDSRAGACMRAQRKGHGRAEWEDSCLQTAKRGLQKPALLPLDHGLLVSYLRENKHLLVYFAWESKPTNTMVRLIMMMMINCNLSLWRAVWNEYQNSIQ